MKLSESLSYISLFTGAGGLDIGLERAGFQNKLCVEKSKNFQQTLRLNRPDWNLSIPGDIEELTSEEVIIQSGCTKGKVELIVGGAPCQPYSKAGYWYKGDVGRLLDERAKTLFHFTRIINDLLPKVVLFENVKGFLYKNKNEAYTYLVKQFKKINRKNGVNYCINPFVVNCADYGVPQTRERFFIVAHREGIKFVVPNPIFDGIDYSHFTAWDAIGDLDVDIWPKELKLNGKWSDLLPSIPEGGNYLWHTNRGGGKTIFGWRTRYWNFLLKLSKSKPSWTIPAQPGPSTGPFHWKSRKLSIREICRLQTIPDDWQIYGNYRDAYMQVGNAVPSLIGEVMGKEIAFQYFGREKESDLTLLPKLNSKKYKIEKPKRVLKKYLVCEDMPDHPGTGRGPGALNRVLKG